MSISNIGIIGYPLGHTLSPVFQNVALKSHGIDEEFQAWPLHPDDLETRVATFRDEGFIACCVTLPHKQAVIPLIDELADTAQAVGAVNWIINDKGTLVGHNTDSPGFLRALTELGNFDPKGCDALVFGAGGAARAIVHAIASAGASSIAIVNRTLDRAQELAKDFGDKGTDIRAIGLNSDDLADAATRADLLVNASSMGMAGGPAPDDSPIHAELISPDAVAYDAVYAPLMTPFRMEAEKSGASSLGGLTMLVLQGAVGFELATGKPAPISAMFESIGQGTGE